ncbi:B12-binding domain-containing radical SAM protein [Geothermobacter hydrogeniphilus]|uniref:B12-binding domain-containing radical SAM protein n=1 Tax=Geothermobacter hydrogeniphilus TaxID=1969733 RepID=A0A2K2HBM4_9BACT|nr:radical SAM protein [Geothermobacter hydrogeniphilus]PNU20633.1 B12-binding domain-containing radical SAM protein [Geothermobacter hydrogeniphilus]
MRNDRLILLVHPLGYHAARADADIARKANVMPPLGLAALAAYLLRAGFDCRIIDINADPAGERRLLELLRSERPAWLGFSCTTASFLDGVRLARLARRELPAVRTVFGGAHVSALQEQVLRDYPEVDFVVVGEGEATLLELLEVGADQAEQVPGLIGRRGKEIFRTASRSLLELDDLPFPAYERLAGYPQRYQLPIFNYPTTPNSSCISSRGCPYACSYCDRSVFGRSFRFNSAEYLYQHLAYLRERFGLRHVNFYDDQFTFQRQRVVDLCQKLLDKPLGMTFNCAVRAEHIDPELLRLMKAAGCWMTSLGIETGDPELLAQHRQNPDLDMMASKLHQIKAAGIRTKGLLMMGLPGESETSIRRSMEYVFSLPIDDFNLAKFTPFPGTPLYEQVGEHGEFDEDWEKMDCMHFQFVPKGFTRVRLEELFTLFYKSHFQRPKVWFGYLTMLWRSPDSWRRFVANLGSFLRFARSGGRRGIEGGADV